jgi:hypothetical protein
MVGTPSVPKKKASQLFLDMDESIAKTYLKSGGST